MAVEHRNEPGVAVKVQGGEFRWSPDGPSVLQVILPSHVLYPLINWDYIIDYCYISS